MASDKLLRENKALKSKQTVTVIVALLTIACAVVVVQLSTGPRVPPNAALVSEARSMIEEQMRVGEGLPKTGDVLILRLPRDHVEVATVTQVRRQVLGSNTLVKIVISVRGVEKEITFTQESLQ